MKTVNRQTVGRLGSAMALVTAMVMLAACGKSLSGTYADSHDVISVTFKSGGKAEMSVMGTMQEVSYEVEGDRVKMIAGNRTELWPILDDGCLKGGGMVGKLCPKK